MSKMQVVDSLTGSELMRRWGVTDWVDPMAEYAVYDDCCVFALVNQGEWLDIHMAMDKSRRRECRLASRAILDVVGMHKLRAVILPGSIGAMNLASRMGFYGKEQTSVKVVSGDTIDVIIMWREPGV